MISQQYAFRNIVVLVVFSALSRWWGANVSAALSLSAVERPSNVTARVGDDVDFKCRISGDAGGQLPRVQWARGEVMLGHDRDILGHPRYTMFGDVSRGEYHLRIKNASLIDDDLFECQVLGGGAVIRAGAYLNVLVAPKRLTIEGRNDGTVIELFENRKQSFSCRAEDTKPTGSVNWYRNGRQIEGDSVSKSVERSSTPKLSHSVTRLEWTATRGDHQAVFACEADHPALAARMSVNFTMHVKYAPSTPEIRGVPDNGEAVLAGTKMTLACEVEGGNPTPAVYWYRNGRSLDVTFETVRRRGASVTLNEYTFVVGADDNAAEYRCQASNTATATPLGAAVRLQVHYAPSTVQINGAATARLGESVRLQCRAGPSHPPSVIRWLVDGKVVVGTEQTVQLPDDKGYETLSNLTINVSSSKTGDIGVLCEATNPHITGGQKNSKQTTHQIIVHYPPDLPSISGYDGEYLSEGASQTISCTATGGKPLAKLEWFKQSNKKKREQDDVLIWREITENVETTAGGNTVTAELKMTVKRSDNRALYKCKASSVALDKPMEANVTFNVYFAPKLVRIETKGAGGLIAGQGARSSELQCEVSSANPSPVVTWVRDDEVVEGQISHNKSGVHGGWSITSRLGLALTPEDDGRRIVCRAEHPAWPSAVTNSTVMHVQYAPVFSDDDASHTRTVSVVEGAAVRVDASARAKPDDVVYRWFRDDTPLHASASSAVRVDNAVLSVDPVGRRQAGVYVCRASNAVGVTNLTVRVTVKYPSSIVRVSPPQEVDLNTKTVIECFVDGFPIGPQYVQWTHNGESVTTGSAEFDERAKASRLTVVSRHLNDSGVYECRIDNGIRTNTDGSAGTSRSSAIVLVRQPPSVITTEVFDRAAADVGRDALLRCVVRAVPAPRIRWSSFKGAQWFVNSTKYSLGGARRLDALGRYEATMRIEGVTVDDYDRYICTAENQLGTVEHAVQLEKSGVPAPPTDVHVLNVTERSLTLSWRAGFDGGATQRFHLRYHVVGAQTVRHTSVDVTTPDADYVPPNDGADMTAPNEHRFTVRNLAPRTRYLVRVGAENAYGRGQYAPSAQLVETLGDGGDSASSSAVVTDELPHLLIAGLVAVGVILVLINILIVCFFMRRNRKKIIKARESRKMKQQRQQAAAAHPQMDCQSSNGKHVLIQSPSGDCDQDQAASKRRVVGNGAAAAPVMMYGNERPESQHLEGSLPPPQHYPGEYSEKDDGSCSLRTVIEIDSEGNHILVEKSSPGAYQTYLVDNPSLIRPPPYEDGASSMAYAEALRTNSLQRRIALGTYAPIPYPEPQNAFYGASASSEQSAEGMTLYLPYSSDLNGYPPMGDDTTPTASVQPLGPLRSINRQLEQYSPATGTAAYPTYHPSPGSTSRNGTLRSRYSPESALVSSAPNGSGAASVFTPSTTPYAEVRPVTRQPQPPPAAMVTRSEGAIGSQTILSTFGGGGVTTAAASPRHQHKNLNNLNNNHHRATAVAFQDADRGVVGDLV